MYTCAQVWISLSYNYSKKLMNLPLSYLNKHKAKFGRALIKMCIFKYHVSYGMNCNVQKNQCILRYSLNIKFINKCTIKILKILACSRYLQTVSLGTIKC